MSRSDHVSRASPSAKPPGRWTGLLKSVGAASAALSFLLVINQATGVLQNFRIHHREFWEAMKIGEQAEQRQDYPAAFASFKHASELDPIDRKAREQETKAAMLWLETAHSAESRSFTDTANQLLPVLDASLANARGTAAADILAHIAWANFLRYRDGAREGVNVDESLKRALSIDKSNPYAHAFSGFWILWQGGSVDAANEHFAAALASGRERAYVRELQFHALSGSHKDEADMALLYLANDMRKNGEAMSMLERARVLQNVFGIRVENHNQLVAVLSLLTPEETQATFDWLNSEETNGWIENWAFRPFIEANLHEITGNRAQALSEYRKLQKDLAGKNTTVAPQVDEAIKRLSAKSN